MCDCSLKHWMVGTPAHAIFQQQGWQCCVMYILLESPSLTAMLMGHDGQCSGGWCTADSAAAAPVCSRVAITLQPTPPADSY